MPDPDATLVDKYGRKSMMGNNFQAFCIPCFIEMSLVAMPDTSKL